MDISGADIESGIGVLNPFRYRGYYYDTETELYFLQTRYYDPVVGRFLNRDSVNYASPETINGLNLYSYCSNNPVMYVDPDGTSFFIASLLAAIIGAMMSAGFEVSKQIFSNGWNPENWDWHQIGLSALGGAVAGIISAIPIGGAVGAFFLGGIGSVAGGLITGSINSWETAILAFGIGAIANVAAYGISNKLANMKADKIFNLSNKAKSLAVQKLQGHQLNMGAIAFKGSFRNAFKQTTQQEIVELIYNANPCFRFNIYSSIISSVMSGWY